VISDGRNSICRNSTFSGPRHPSVDPIPWGQDET
jgi:hypothetical protein